MSKKYFANVKNGDKVFGTVFGEGKVINVLGKDNHFTFEVQFKNGSQIHYTEEGIPNWGNFKEQTLFYKNDIDKNEYEKTMSFKKISKLMNKHKLEVRVPSGLWQDATLVEPEYLENILSNNLMFLFREKE